MSREELSTFLRGLQLALDGLQREVEAALRRVPDTQREALPELLAGCRRKLQRFGEEQLAELDGFAVEAGLQQEGGEPGGAATPGAAAPGDGAEGSPYYGVQLRSLETRVAAMGGIPALGPCALPRMTPGLRPPLNATASPAAVEIMQRRLGGEDATPLKRAEEQPKDTRMSPLIQLRATPAAAPKPTPPAGAAPHQSELAAAMARRVQRLASASPDKGAADG